MNSRRAEPEKLHAKQETVTSWVTAHPDRIRHLPSSLEVSQSSVTNRANPIFPVLSTTCAKTLPAPRKPAA